jgi:cobalamin biosynthesis protein CobD/CbiB
MIKKIVILFRFHSLIVMIGAAIFFVASYVFGAQTFWCLIATLIFAGVVDVTIKSILDQMLRSIARSDTAIQNLHELRYEIDILSKSKTFTLADAKILEKQIEGFIENLSKPIVSIAPEEQQTQVA